MNAWKVTIDGGAEATVQGDNIMDAIVDVIERGWRLADIVGVVQSDCTFRDVRVKGPSSSLLEERKAQFQDELDFVNQLAIPLQNKEN